VSFDKILRRIKTIGQEVGVKINYTNLVNVIDQLYDNISTTKLDELSAEQCAVMASIHTDYNISPEESRFPTTIKHEQQFSDVVKTSTKTPTTSPGSSRSSQKNYTTCGNAEFIDGVCDYSRDYLIDYFGFKTLEKSYLIRKNKRW
jgi:ribonucleoside-diphosphate reductase alpha chain/ribonucleoside-diphosphate reductase subunit M1